MKVLFANCGYLTGINGQINEYVLLFWRYIFGSSPASQILIDTIKYENPDVCLFVEIKRSSTKKLFNELLEYPHAVMVEKYGTGLLSKLGKTNVHLILSKKEFESIDKILLSGGQKRTVLRAKIGGINFYACHLSLNKSSREKQINDLIKIFNGSGRSVLVGDFNTFSGKEEVLPLTLNTSLQDINIESKKTFPAYEPNDELDYIFATKDIQENNFTVLPEVFSDHRALICNIN